VLLKIVQEKGPVLETASLPGYLSQLPNLLPAEIVIALDTQDTKQLF
jgi:hypothetical protein